MKAICNYALQRRSLAFEFVKRRVFRSVKGTTSVKNYELTEDLIVMKIEFS